MHKNPIEPQIITNTIESGVKSLICKICSTNLQQSSQFQI